MIKRACKIASHGDSRRQPFTIVKVGLVEHDYWSAGQRMLAESIDEIGRKAFRNNQ